MYEFLWRLPPTLYLAIQQTFRSGNRVLSLFSIIGITVSVALAVGLESASRAVDAELDRTSSALSGRANLHVTAGPAGIRDSMIAELRTLPGVETASPLMIASLWLEDGAALHVVGVDFFADQKVHEYSIRERGVEVRDSLRLVSLPDSIVVTRALSQRLGLDLGDRLDAKSATGPVELVVRGILESGGIADAYGGQVAAMDVFGLQLLVGRPGLVDRIDVVVSAESQDSVAEALRHRTAGVAEVSISPPGGALGGVVRTLRGGVLMVVVIGMSVAGFISYTTATMSSDRRLRELALLQLAGLSPRGVRALILTESLVVGALAIAIGAPLGGAAADQFLGFFSSVATNLTSVAFAPVGLSLRSLGVAFVVGVLISVLAAVPAAQRALRTRPLDVLSPSSSRTDRLISLSARFWTASALTALALTLPNVPAYVRLAIVLPASAYAILTGTQRWLRPSVEAMRPVLDVFSLPIGDLVGSSLTARPNRAAQAITTIAVTAGAALAILASIESITSSVDSWAASRFAGGARVIAGDPLQLHREKVRQEVVDRIRTARELAALMATKATLGRYAGGDILIMGADLHVRAQYTSLGVVSGSSEALLKGLQEGQVGITDVFASRFGVGVDEIIELATPSGAMSFRVSGILRDYSTVGQVIMSLRRFDSIWSEPGYGTLGIWPKGELNALIAEIRRDTSDLQVLTFEDGEAAAQYGSLLFARFSALFYALGALAAGVGAVSIANLLVASVVERRTELALLRIAGVSTRQLSAAVIADAVLLAGVGTICGAALALLWLRPMLNVASSSFGWGIGVAIDPAQTGAALALAIAIAALSGIYPSWRARRELLTRLPLPE